MEIMRMWAVGALIAAIFAIVYAMYTFFTNKFDVGDCVVPEWDYRGCITTIDKQESWETTPAPTLKECLKNDVFTIEEIGKYSYRVSSTDIFGRSKILFEHEVAYNEVDCKTYEKL